MHRSNPVEQSRIIILLFNIQNIKPCGAIYYLTSQPVVVYRVNNIKLFFLGEDNLAHFFEIIPFLNWWFICELPITEGA